MADTYKIIFDGQLRPGTEPTTARQNLARLFGTEPDKVEHLFSGTAVSLKSGLTHTDAQNYLAALQQAGLEARVETEPGLSLSLDKVEPAYPGSSAPLAEPESPYAPPRASVTPGLPAVGTLKVFTVQGRIGRLRYLAWSMALMLAALVATAVVLGLINVSLVAGGLVGTVAFVAFMVVSIQIGAQRMHDAGWSAWMLLLNLIPFVGNVFPFLMMAVPGTKGPNRFGAPPPPNSRAVKLLSALWLLMIVLVIVAAIAGGLDAVQKEIDASTAAYEQALPYDDADTAPDEDE